MHRPVDGFVRPGFEPLLAAFTQAFSGRPTMGAALAVRVDGQTVVDLWGGTADERTGAPWTERTPTVIFSCTKGLMSLLAARLVEEGRLDYDAEVAAYWPEFAAAGKGDITVRQALSHQAGLSAPIRDLSFADILDWPVVVGALASQAPLWPIGSGYAYHALTHGWLIGELVRRVTGLSPGTYFRDVVRPLSVDAWIGRAGTDPATAHLQLGPDLAEFWRNEERRMPQGEPNWSLRAMTLGSALPAPLVTDTGGFNDPVVQRAEIPGAGGIATAKALATIWSATVAETEGHRILSRSTVEAATRVETEGPPVFPADPPYARWGMGFQLDSEARRYLGPTSFGHVGAGGQVAFADPASYVGFAFVTNWMEGPGDERATAIIDALRAVLRA